jgi:hypothetical protein
VDRATLAWLKEVNDAKAYARFEVVELWRRPEYAWGLGMQAYHLMRFKVE